MPGTPGKRCGELGDRGSRPANHRCDRWGSSHLDLAERLEAVTLVQGDVTRTGRLEVRWDAIAIAPLQHADQQGRSVPLALLFGIDADEWQVPVGLPGMESAHLLEHGEHGFLQWIGHG